MTDINLQNLVISRGELGVLLLLPVPERTFQQFPIGRGTAWPKRLNDTLTFLRMCPERQAGAVAYVGL